MRVVRWTDDDGYKRSRLVRDADPTDLETVQSIGIPLEPPDMRRIDWEEVQRDLHNTLMDNGLLTWRDVQRSQNGVTSAILSALRRRVIALYRNIEP